MTIMNNLNKVIIFAFVIVFVFFGIFLYSNSLNNNGKGKLTESSPTPENQTVLLGIFRGTLPCADCSGLETELTLIKNNNIPDTGSYVLKETYLGKSDKPIETKGVWTLKKGTKTSKEASVYVLNPNDPQTIQLYLNVNDTEIRLLDREGNEIDSPFNETLTKE